MSRFIDLTGKKFNKLTVEKRLENAKGGVAVWLCKCDCGNYTTVRGGNLKNGAVKSCGCLTHIPKNKLHGMKNSRLYSLWNAMKSRCNNPNIKSYIRYGGRGISVCDEWEKSFLSFYNWAINNGYKDNLSIDRIDNNGNYCPENCRWITFEEQCNNRRTNIVFEYNGEKHNLMQWCKLLNLDYKFIHNRIYKMKWDFEKAITTPKSTDRKD